VLFILATTELNKIPPTVLSRCQRFDFKRITQSDIADHLGKIVAASGRRVTPEALRMIAELGDGSMRDSLSILEQVLGYSDEEIGYDDLLSIMGIADHDALFDICRAIADGDSDKALTVFDSVIEKGKEPEVFIDRLTHFLRDVLVTKVTREPERIVNTSQEHLEKMKSLAEAFSREKLIFALKHINEAVVSAKASGYARTVYELCLVKLATPSYDTSFEALLARMADLEAKLSKGIPATTNSPSLEAPPWDGAAPMPKEPAAANMAEPKKAEVSPAANKPEEVKSAPQSGDNSILGRFDEIKDYIRAHGGAPVIPHINRATPMMLGGQFSLVFAKDAMMNKTVVARAGNIELIQIAIGAVTGEEVKVQCLSEKEAGISTGDGDAFEQLLELGKQHSEIEII